MSCEPTVRVWVGGLHGWVTVPASEAPPTPTGRKLGVLLDRPPAHGRDCAPDEPAWQTPDCSWSERSYFPTKYPRTK